VQVAAPHVRARAPTCERVRDGGASISTFPLGLSVLIKPCSVNPTLKGIEYDWSGPRDILIYIGFNPAFSPPIRPDSDVTERALR
jgi:hypothetical protein